MAYGEDIPAGFDSATAWVTRTGAPTGKKEDAYAQEIVLREGKYLLPRFVLRLKRVAKTLVWVDPNIRGSYNDGLAEKLRLGITNTRVVATASPELAAQVCAGCILQSNTKGKENSEFRLVTAGRGGQELLTSVKAVDSMVQPTMPCLVFCMAAAYHATWAAAIPVPAGVESNHITVTSSAVEMQKFCLWWCGDVPPV